MAPDPDMDRLRPAHILESMANSVSALFYSFLVAKLSKTHSVALKHGVLLSLSPKDKYPNVNLLTCRVTMQFFVLLTMFIHLWKKEYGKIYMISDAGHHFTQAAPITPFLGTHRHYCRKYTFQESLVVSFLHTLLWTGVWTLFNVCITHP